MTSAAIDELIMDLSKKLRVTSVVVTHEMDSAFRIADRMVMLDKGRVLLVASREVFESIRRRRTEELATEDERLIHQFLNGDTKGPLSDSETFQLYERQIMAGSRETME